ncbi:MAG: hypothetical protein AUG51_23170 [Acidobacteria bacterium 13_1_20CM_3_53_8]|nr:MAG: hypothetical protein AUG51_23170 [Acidobacteria bacterium 13_1_20CM_3_53_8]
MKELSCPHRAHFIAISRSFPSSNRLIALTKQLVNFQPEFIKISAVIEPPARSIRTSRSTSISFMLIFYG